MKKMYHYNTNLIRGINMNKCLAYITFLSLFLIVQGAQNQTLTPESVNNTIEDQEHQTRTKVIIELSIGEENYPFNLAPAF